MKNLFQEQESIVSFTNRIKDQLFKTHLRTSYYHNSEIEEAIREVIIDYNYELYSKTVYRKSVWWRLSSVFFYLVIPILLLIALFNWIVYGKWGVRKQKWIGRLIDTWIEKIYAKD